jgi:amidohydrolase
MLARAQALQDQLIHWRRQIHQWPELGFCENRTAALVSEVLQSTGYRVRIGVGRTGVVADCGQGHPVVAIRADMDALPIQEENAVAYASQVPGVMHACGHDAHVSIALGVATLLAQEELTGTIRFLFQPAEEVADDEGLSGASRMVQDGAMEGVDAVLALHVNAGAPAGEVAVEAGPASAGVDTFWVTINGQGGHGAYPHKGVDPILIAGYVILALHSIISRRLDPFDAAVISLGSIHAGRVSNVIPDKVQLSGTIRYEQPEVQRRLHSEIERALSVARALGGDYDLKLELGGGPMINDPDVVEVIRRSATDLLGADYVKNGEKSMGAEDFGIFSALAPGAMFRLGCQAEGADRRAHSPTFDLDERCLPVGVAVLAEAALRLLNRA